MNRQLQCQTDGENTKSVAGSMKLCKMNDFLSCSVSCWQLVAVSGENWGKGQHF